MQVTAQDVSTMLCNSEPLVTGGGSFCWRHNEFKTSMIVLSIEVQLDYEYRTLIQYCVFNTTSCVI
jgi:hypothetical protein